LPKVLAGTGLGTANLVCKENRPERVKTQNQILCAETYSEKRNLFLPFATDSRCQQNPEYYFLSHFSPVEFSYILRRFSYGSGLKLPRPFNYRYRKDVEPLVT
jgi:hypothetical protein